MDSLISYHAGNLFDSEAEVIGYEINSTNNTPTKTTLQLQKSFLEKYPQNHNYRPIKTDDCTPETSSGKILPWMTINPLDPVIINMFIQYSQDTIPNLKNVQTALLRTMLFMSAQKYPLTTLAIPKIEVDNNPLIELNIDTMIHEIIRANPIIAIEIWQLS